jgi:hypothetical protein
VADLRIATETSTSASQTIAFMIRGPIATGDVPGLCFASAHCWR